MLFAMCLYALTSAVSDILIRRNYITETFVNFIYVIIAHTRFNCMSRRHVTVSPHR